MKEGDMNMGYIINDKDFINDNIFTSNYEFVKKLLTIYMRNA